MESFELELNNKEEAMEENFSKEAFLKEKGVFEKLSGKAKEIAGVLMFISSLSFAPGVVKETFAGKKRAILKQVR